MYFNVAVAVGQPKIAVRWPADIGAPTSTSYRRLFDELIDLPGVEEVTMRRYSATIVFADHVITGMELAAQVRSAIKDTGFLTGLAEDLGIPETDISVE